MPRTLQQIRERRAHRGLSGLGFLDYQEGDGWWYYEDVGGNWWYGDESGYYEGNAYGDWAGYDIWGNTYNPEWWNDPLVSQTTNEPYSSIPTQGAGSVIQSAVDELLDWWATLTGGSAGPLPPSPEGCPPNHYCVDFPICSQCRPIDNASTRRTAQNQARQQQQAKQASQQAAQRKQQQQQQQCQPPMVRSAVGQCVCPQGYTLVQGRCVLSSTLPRGGAPSLSGIPNWIWLALAGLVGFKVLSGGSDAPGRRRR